MESELERAKVRLNSAQDVLMDAQLTWAHAHRDWLQAVNKSARGAVSEHTSCGATTKGTGCGTCDVCKAVKVIMRGSGEGDTPEKRVDGVGPHTSPRASGGCTCHWHQAECPGACPLPATATHHATHATQVPANTGLDTTSHG